MRNCGRLHVFREPVIRCIVTRYHNEGRAIVAEVEVIVLNEHFTKWGWIGRWRLRIRPDRFLSSNIYHLNEPMRPLNKKIVSSRYELNTAAIIHRRDVRLSSRIIEPQSKRMGTVWREKAQWRWIIQFDEYLAIVWISTESSVSTIVIGLYSFNYQPPKLLALQCMNVNMDR